MDGYTEELFTEWTVEEFIYGQCLAGAGLVDSDMVILVGGAGDLAGVSVGGLHLAQSRR